MYLTEEQRSNREELFIELMEMIAEDLYEESEADYEMTQEDMDTANAMMEYFVENFKELSLQESAAYAMSNIDPNQELIEEFIEAVLDESIGGAVAGAVHGIRNLVSKYRAGSAQKNYAKASGKQFKLYDKMQAAKKSAKGSTGMVGAYRKAKAGAIEKRRTAAFQKMNAAHDKMRAAQQKHAAGVAKQAGLKNKIDTAVRSAGERLAGAAGRLVGRFA
jgi:hypothetical protein